MLTCDVKTDEPFESLFPIGGAVLNEIAKDMEANGYDHVYPIVIWKEKGVVIDGHTRLTAARSAKILDVPVVEKSFADEDEAVLYAIHSQRARRNITDGDLLRWIGELDRRKTKKEAGSMKGQLPSCEGSLEPRHQRTTANQTAEALGISRAKVERARAVMDHAPEETKQDVMENNKTLNRAYTEVREAKKAEEEAAKPKEERTKIVFYEGLKFCAMAISQMDRIQPNDVYRTEAYAKMQAWLDSKK